MWLIRPAHTADTDAVLLLASSMGPGMTTFPADRNVIAAKVENAAASFAGDVGGADAQYLLVMEDTDTGSILGVSAVYPEIGQPFGFFSYHMDRLVQHAPTIEYHLDCSVLNLSNAYTGLTEIGTLAVDPAVRGGGAGKMLAKARYLLMASFPGLFADRVIAEMRGWQNPDGSSPFWNAVGRRFFGLDFAQADALSAVQGAEFIANLMPKFPIYLDLLPDSVRDVVGRPHQTSAIAMKMLIEEGFRFENYVDVFDAGPQVIAPLSNIRTVEESFRARLGEHTTDPEASGVDLLVCNSILEEFRLVRTRGRIDGGVLSLRSAASGALRLDSGDEARAVSIG
ncbi:MAG: arginine N-succinyltransferase [Acidimicrobiales bacterium]